MNISNHLKKNYNYIKNMKNSNDIDGIIKTNELFLNNYVINHIMLGGFHDSDKCENDNKKYTQAIDHLIEKLLLNNNNNNNNNIDFSNFNNLFDVNKVHTLRNQIKELNNLI